MNKALYIVGIVFSVVFLLVAGFYIGEVASARISSLFSNYDYGSYYSSYSSTINNEYKELTFSASLWSLFFFLVFITVDLMGLMKIKTRTTKVLSIIGLSISGIFLLWNFAVMFSDGGITFDEVGGAYVFYCFIMLAFTIVGLIQAVRFGKKGNQPAMVYNQAKDILDA